MPTYTSKFTYRPPPLNQRVYLRNPSSNPPQTEDPYGRSTTDWTNHQTEVFAGRRDFRPQTDNIEGGQVFERQTVWTIRNRSGIDANVEIVHNGAVYKSLGPPVLRGGRAEGIGKYYLDIHTTLRR